MQAIRHTVTVPQNRELRIQLPDEAIPLRAVEIIVLFETGISEAERAAEMQAAMNDPLFVADLQAVMNDFQHLDQEGWPA